MFGEVLPAAIDRLRAALAHPLAITQAVPPEALASVEELYRKIGVAAELSSFFEDVPQRLAAAHLLISRAGASSVAEITSVGCPAMLVPYPHCRTTTRPPTRRPSSSRRRVADPQDEFTPSICSARLEECSRIRNCWWQPRPGRARPASTAPRRVSPIWYWR